MSTNFTGEIHQNKSLAPGANLVSAVLVLNSSIAKGAAAALSQVRTGTGRVIGLCADKSGSMAGDKWRAAKQALREAVALLPEDCEFFVLLGGDSNELLVSLRKATKANKDAAIDLIRNADHGGGTYFGKWLDGCTEIFKQRPQAINVLVFLTDGKNEGETGSELTNALRRANGLYSCECRGVGVGYVPDELRRIQKELGGSVDGFTNPSELAADFQQIIERTKGLAVSSAALQLWTPVGATVKKVSQQEPQIVDLSAKITPAPSNPRAVRVDLGPWGEESRLYHVVVELLAANVGTVGGPEKLVARASIIITEGGVETEIKLNDGGKIVAEWTDDEKKSAVINPKVAQATGQTELADKIQEGIKALNDGDEEKATKALARATELAEQTGNDEATKRLAKFVETDAGGTKRLKRGISQEDKVSLDTQSTRTKRVK